MTIDQTVVFATLAAALVLFVWGRFRYDLVAMMALLAVLLSGALPIERAFEGFAHPAVITVAAVLVISRALQQAGLVDVIVRVLAPLAGRPSAQLVVQTAIVAVLSAFMNNVGALALMMPVALRQAYRDGYSPAIALMPLAFGSILGGLATLIGTPPNLLISTFRARETGEAFGMFAFAPVGAPVALAGIAFVALIGWRLLPKDRRAAPDPERLFDVTAYVTELRVPEESALAGSAMSEVEALADGDARVIGLVRGETRRLAPRAHERMEGGDLLVIEADASALKAVVSGSDLVLEEEQEISRDDLKNDEVTLAEVIVPPGSRLQGRSSTTMRLRSVHGVNLLAIARHGARVDGRLSEVRLQVGDVLLLQGPSERVADAVGEFGLLPLAQREVTVAKPTRLALSASIFGVAIAAVVIGLLPVHVAFATAAVLMVLLGVLGRDEPYEAIDWPVIVLLGAMIPVGTALEATGGTALMADAVIALTGDLGPLWVLVALMVVTMMLSDVINNNATAVLMAPLAIDLAGRLGVSMDPLLMAVAIGASCAFLTPIGHQSNTLVLKPGGYRFGDYWRMGLPLEIVIVVVSVPLILVVWPW
ncbi:MAG: SLC13 family permease [Trueperaceae bacterium]|nr:SLC13 family permease [Trueperaceae bacterium]